MFQSLSTALTFIFKSVAHFFATLHNLLAQASATTHGDLEARMAELNISEDSIKAVNRKSDLFIGINHDKK